MSDIANRFKQIREDKNLTVTAMAAVLLENRQHIQDIESGKQRIPEDVILKYIEHFDIDANWLLTGKGTMYRNSTSEKPASYEVSSLKALEALFYRVDDLEKQLSEMRKQA